MQVEIARLGEVQFEAIARGHRVICDQPPVNGGMDTGMTPPEFLLVALGTCGGFYAAQYLKARSLPADGLKIKVTADKAAQPARLARFQMEVNLPALEPQHQAGVLRAVKACLIHNTLLNQPAIEVAIPPLLKPRPPEEPISYADIHVLLSVFICGRNSVTEPAWHETLPPNPPRLAGFARLWRPVPAEAGPPSPSAEPPWIFACG
jgi:putative redox protein